VAAEQDAVRDGVGVGLVEARRVDRRDLERPNAGQAARGIGGDVGIVGIGAVVHRVASPVEGAEPGGEEDGIKALQILWQIGEIDA
jgi:hypothetical protein